MRKFYSALLIIALTVSVAAPSIATAEDQQSTAQDATTAQTTQANQTDSADDSKKPEDSPEDAATETKNRSKRIDEYKKQAAQKLTQAQQKKVTSVCKTSQEKVSSVHGRLQSAVEKRKNYYATVTGKLEELSVKLEAASIDVTELKAAMTEIDAKATAISQAATDYETALTDLSAMDCVSDPAGFKAALTVAREKRTTLQTQVQALREYMKTTVKDLLKTLREQVAQVNNASDDNV